MSKLSTTKSMTNFSTHLFELIRSIVEETVVKKYSVERGKRSTMFGIYALFMPLSVLKNGEDCHFLARTFRCKKHSFERAVYKYTDLAVDYLYE